MYKISKFIASFFFALNIYSAELAPLSEYMIKADPNDPVSVEVISKRCSSINLAMTRFSREGDQVYELALQNYLAWFYIATEARALKYPNDHPIKSAENIRDSILNITEEIDKQFTQNQDFTGSLFEGTYLEDDIKICGQMMKEIAGIKD